MLLRRTVGDELAEQAREAVRVLEVWEVSRALEQLDAAVWERTVDAACV